MTWILLLLIETYRQHFRQLMMVDAASLSAALEIRASSELSEDASIPVALPARADLS